MPKGKHENHVSGRRHYLWNGGRIRSSHGYVKVRVGDEHPLADPNGYAYEHLLVLAAAGRAPSRDDVIHHRNGDRTDNRIENLEVMSRAEHNRIHRPKRGPDGRFLKAAGRELDGRTWDEFPRELRADP